MAETLEDRGSGLKWHWDDVQADLRRAGAVDVCIDPLTVREHSCGGEHAGQRFYLTWVGGHFAMLTTPDPHPTLVRALACVLGDPPFCAYRDGRGLWTVEWERSAQEQAERLRHVRARGLEPHAPTLCQAADEAETDG